MIKLKNHIFFISNIVCVLCLFLSDVNAQTALVTGKIIEDSSKKPVPYANLTLISKTSSDSVFGGISGKNGNVLLENINYGTYTAKISFIGFETKLIENLNITTNKFDIGTVELSISSENIDQVTVTGHKKGLSYAVDRKVIDAKSFPGADVAMDLLENMPSLQVDFEGKLTYRGDGTFKVFINGHQIKNGEEKLRQLSSEKIDYIEIITNPSAKYDAEGTAGIIQVILKRNRLEGFVLSTSAKTSTVGSYEWQFSIDQKGERGGWYVEGLIDEYITGKANIEEFMRLSYDDDMLETLSEYATKKKRVNSFLELGFNYDLTSKDYVDFTVNIDPIRRSENSYNNGVTTENTFTDGNLVEKESYLYDSQSKMNFRYLGSTFVYEHAFTKNREHLLSAYIDFNTYLHPLKEKKVDRKTYSDREKLQGYIGQEDNEIAVTSNIGYENKLGKNSSFEVGAEADIYRIPQIATTSGTFDESGDFTPFSDEFGDQEVDFKQDVYSSYLTFKSSVGIFEYQLGLRGEYTDRKSNYSYTDDGAQVLIPAETDFYDLFPTFHGLFNFSKESQLVANYSRRINRPSYWNLAPLKQYNNPYSYYQGNGNLMPSYVNAFELGYKKSWENNFVGCEVFVRNTTDIIQSYQIANETENLIWTKENVGDSWSIGTELMAGFDVFEWWSTNISTSLYQYNLSVDINQEDRTEKQFRTDSRINNSFYIGNSLTYKFDVLYKSPLLTAQYKRDDYWYSNMALRKTFNNSNWQILLSWSDVFNSINYSRKSIDDGFDFIYDYDRVSYATVKVTYTLDNQK